MHISGTHEPIPADTLQGNSVQGKEEMCTEIIIKSLFYQALEIGWVGGSRRIGE